MDKGIARLERRKSSDLWVAHFAVRTPLLLIRGMGKFGCFAVIAVMVGSQGFGCLSCCGRGAADSSCHESSPRVASETLPSPQAASVGHRCCKPSGEDKGQVLGAPASTPIGRKDGCRLMGHWYHPAVLPHAVGIAIQPPLPGGQTPPHASTSRRLPIPSGYSVPDRGSTYLRCCAFLI
jgi:hypothetical protein